MITSVFLVMVQWLLVATVSDFVCEDDFSPCSCQYFDPFGLIVRCGNPLTDTSVSVLDVQRALNRSSVYHIFWLDLIALSPATESSTSVALPPNFLCGKLVDRIGIGSSTSSNQAYQLEVDLDAFQSSVEHLIHFEITGFDLSRLDFRIFHKMSSLIGLSFDHVTRIRGLPTDTSLLNLKSLRLHDVPDFVEWSEIARTFIRLESLYLDDDKLEDFFVSKLLQSIINSFNRKTIRQLSLWGNRLTVVPKQLQKLPYLSYLNLFGNAIQSLPKKSIFFHPDVKVSFVILTNNKLDKIEPGAFQGNFSEASIYLDFNFLTRFESSVFEEILEQMFHSRSESSDASLNVQHNPFDCDNLSHLAWIICDKRHLLSHVNGARCSNGTRFEDLSTDTLLC